jgi:hypothetical protein
MKLELGKEYIDNVGDTCVVLDLDFNGTVVTKYSIGGSWVLHRHTISGASLYDRSCDIIKEKPQELTLVQYVVLYTSKDKPNHLLCWGIYSDPRFLAVAKSNIISSGYNFYGTQKVTLRSDGTKENINF